MFQVQSLCSLQIQLILNMPALLTHCSGVFKACFFKHTHTPEKVSLTAEPINTASFNRC